MKHVRWRFKDVGPNFATPEGMEKTHQQRMRTIMGLAEDHEVVYEDQPKKESPILTGDTVIYPNNPEKNGFDSTDNNVSDGDSNVDKPKTLPKRSRRTKTKPKTP